MNRAILIIIAALFLTSCGVTNFTKKKATLREASGQETIITTSPGTMATFEATRPDGTTIKAVIDDKTVPWYKAVGAWIMNKPEYQISN